MMWGKRKENGLWLARTSRWRLMLGGGDRIVYAALGRLRLRLMKMWGHP